jgi:FtsP/CotA-like multicopper oxidase with cupredoxin domain
MKIVKSFKNTGCVITMVSMLVMSFGAQAAIDSVDGQGIDLYAKKIQITTPDGDSIQLWTFAPDAAGGGMGVAQYPGPTLRVTQGQMVNVTLHNVDVPQNVSLVFPGQSGVTSIGPASLPMDDGTATITYEFEATNPGTYLYQSGVSPQVQVDMGLAGALIVDPAGATVPAKPDEPNYGTPGAYMGVAYDRADASYDREYLFFLSEMDPKLHYLAEDNADALLNWDNAAYVSQLFFINGRLAPDSMAPNLTPELPHQPYGSLVQMHPGERVLMRMVNVGRNQHPFHTHGNHFEQVARDGNLLAHGVLDYTLGAVPGSTADLVWEWTGKSLGWDIYDHKPGDPLSPWEDAADHGKPLPVVIPEDQDLAFGGFYSGSPFLGEEASLPIGEGGLNPSGGVVMIWHSHTERELTNNDIFPGGMMTMMIIEHSNTVIE